VIQRPRDMGWGLLSVWWLYSGLIAVHPPRGLDGLAASRARRYSRERGFAVFGRPFFRQASRIGPDIIVIWVRRFPSRQLQAVSSYQPVLGRCVLSGRR